MTRRSFVACKSINRSHRGNRSLHALVGPDVSPNRPQPKHARGVGCLLQECQRSTPAPAAASAVPLACRHGLLADQVVDDAVKNLDETLRAEEPGDTAVPEDTIDVDADAAADPAQGVRKRSSGILARTNDVKNLTEKVTACAEKMLAAPAGKAMEAASKQWAKKSEQLRVAVAALEETRKALAEKEEAKEAKEAAKLSLKKYSVWSDVQTVALVEIVVNNKELKDSVNSSATAWESIAQIFNTLCIANLWDTPPGGFKTAALIGKYNEIKNLFYSYCRHKQFGESGDDAFVGSAREALVAAMNRPVFQLFIEANMQNKAAAVSPFTISGAGTARNELVAVKTGPSVDVVLVRHGGTRGRDSAGNDVKYRGPERSLKRTRTVAPPDASEDDRRDDTLPAECFDTGEDSAPSSQEPITKKPKKTTVVEAMNAAALRSDQMFLAAFQGQSDNLMKMIVPSTHASNSESSGHQELEDLFPLLEQAHAAARRCTDPLDPMRPFHQTRIEFYEAKILKLTAHATHSPRY